MNPIALLLWALGVSAIIVGGRRVRGPWARLRQLQETQANLRRYDVWRGTRPTSDAGPTGADEMMRQMRQRVMLWGAVIGVGVVLIVAGLAVR